MICLEKMKPHNAYEINGGRRQSSISMANPSRTGSFCSLPSPSSATSNRLKKNGKRHSIDFTTSSRLNFQNTLAHISVGDDVSYGDDDSVQDESNSPLNSRLDPRDSFSSRSPVKLQGTLSETNDHNERSETTGNGFNSDKLDRAIGNAPQAIGTSVHVLCRMRPLSTSSSFILQSSPSYGAGTNSAYLNVTNNRNSLPLNYNKNEDDDSDEDEDDSEGQGTWKRKGEESTNFTITGNFLEYFDESNHSKGVFEFSKIFNERASQKKVFSSPEILNILDSLFLGFNGTIFTYGQTNSGKTFTMEGQSINNPKNRGILPRSIRYVFSTINETMKKQALEKEKNNLLLLNSKSNLDVDVDSDLNVNVNLNLNLNDDNTNINNQNNNDIKQNSYTDFTISVSYYEIYCERVRDILNPSSDNMKLRETKNDGFVVQDLTEITCQTESEVIQILEKGKINRATASTLMNAVSSRSHSIFCITIKQRITVTNTVNMNSEISSPSTPTTPRNDSKFDHLNYPENNEENGRSGCVSTNVLMRKSRLFLVDLAGSEKVSQTGAEGKKK